MKRFIPWKSTLVVVFVFSIAMGLLESAVVVYLQKIYFPYGFNFPLNQIHEKTIAIEVYREFATLIMLICIGILAGKNRLQKFAYFIFSFAVWDIFYYIFLSLFIHWPDSLFTWDILFLIPVFWVAPVICPIVVSATMILLALIIIHRSNRDQTFSISMLSWYFLIAGSIVLILSFTWEYSVFLIQSHGFKTMVKNLFQSKVDSYALEYIPYKFNWLFFIAGELIIQAGILTIFLPRTHKK